MTSHLREDYTARRVQPLRDGDAVTDLVHHYTRCSCGTWSSSHQDDRVRSLAYVAHLGDAATVPELAVVLARARHQATTAGRPRAARWEELPTSTQRDRVEQAVPFADALYHLLTGG